MPVVRRMNDEFNLHSFLLEVLRKRTKKTTELVPSLCSSSSGGGCRGGGAQSRDLGLERRFELHVLGQFSFRRQRTGGGTNLDSVGLIGGMGSLVGRSDPGARRDVAVAKTGGSGTSWNFGLGLPTSAINVGQLISRNENLPSTCQQAPALDRHQAAKDSNPTRQISQATLQLTVPPESVLERCRPGCQHRYGCWSSTGLSVGWLDPLGPIRAATSAACFLLRGIPVAVLLLGACAFELLLGLLCGGLVPGSG